MDISQFREYIVRPALEHIKLYSPAAENLVVGTALQESHLDYVRQLGGGPAVGIYQMEKPTHDDIWANFLPSHQSLATLIRQLALPFYEEDFREMAGNLYYATAMCRVHYRRVKESLPTASDIPALGRYRKRYYNTPKGKGTVEEFINNYNKGNK